jgi:hypothetical protein
MTTCRQTYLSGRRLALHSKITHRRSIRKGLFCLAGYFGVIRSEYLRHQLREARPIHAVADLAANCLSARKITQKLKIIRALARRINRIG